MWHGAYSVSEVNLLTHMNHSNGIVDVPVSAKWSDNLGPLANSDSLIASV